MSKFMPQNIIESLRVAIFEQDGAKVFHLTYSIVQQYDEGLILAPGYQQLRVRSYTAAN